MTAKEEKQKIDTARNYEVVKYNTLIQKTRFSFTLQEQRIITYLISQIKPDDKDILEKEFNIIDFCKICGIDYDNGGNYKYIKDTLQKLYNKSAWIDTGNKITLFSWLSLVEVEKNKGTIRIKLHEFLKPYLIDLRDNFTKYELYYTLAMRSQYSIRLYEILKSYQWLREGKVEFEVEELKKLMDAENHIIYNNFKRKVLDIALREIDELTDLNITCTPKKDGKKYTKIEFTIKQRKDVLERLTVWGNIENRLDKKETPNNEPEQLNIFK